MNKLVTRLMKGTFLALCLAALGSTAAFAQIQRSVGLGKIDLATSQGAAHYEHDMLSTIADFKESRYTFYFKVPGFTSGNAAADARLVKVLDADNHSLISYDGKFTEPLKRPAPGQTGTVRMSGTLKYQGKRIKTDLTAKTYLRDGKLVLETAVPLDSKGTELARKASAGLGVKTPVNLTIIASY